MVSSDEGLNAVNGRRQKGARARSLLLPSYLSLVLHRIANPTLLPGIATAFQVDSTHLAISRNLPFKP